MQGLTEETCSEDSYDADTITEWLQDANSIEGDSDAGHIEMNATSGFFQKLKSDSPEQARSDATASPGNTSSAAEHSNIRKRTNGA